MKMVYKNEVLELVDFATQASECFKSDEKIKTFTLDGQLKSGHLMALRWGMDDDCVVIIKIDEFFEPIIFQQIIKKIT